IRDYKVTGVQTCALPILRVCLRHPRSPFKERGQDTTQPYRLSALIKPIDALPSQIVKEHLQLSTLVAELDQQRRLNAAAIDRSRSEERRVGKEGRIQEIM